jgi:hypothetical protein
MSEDGADRFGDPVVRAAVREWTTVRGVELIVPQQPLAAAGRSGAVLREFIVRRRHADPQRILIKVSDRGRGDAEATRHEAAMRANPTFAQSHLVGLAYDPWPVGEDRLLMFQELAPDSVRLGDLHGDELVSASRYAARLLTGWTPIRTHSVVTVRDYLDRELNRGVSSPLADQLAQRFGLHSDRVDVDGTSRLNPVWLCGDDSTLGDSKVDVECGHAHGDLHVGNVLVPRDRRGRPRWEGIRLVDLAGFEEDAPLTRDLVTLVLSALLPTLTELPPGQAANLARLVVEPDLDVPGGLPAEVADLVAGVYHDGTPAALRDRRPWYRQYLLSVVAEALRHATYADAGERGRRWYLGVAARAADAVAPIVAGPTAERPWSPPSQPPTRPAPHPSRPATAPARTRATTDRTEESGPGPTTVAARAARSAPRRSAIALTAAAAMVAAYLAVRTDAEPSDAPVDRGPAARGPALIPELWAAADEVGGTTEPVTGGRYERTEVVRDTWETTPGGTRQREREIMWRRSDGFGCRVHLPADPGAPPVPEEQSFEPNPRAGTDEEPSDDPAVLRYQLRRTHAPEAGPAGDLRAVADLFARRHLAPAQRAAALRVLATTQGITPRGTRSDSQGRIGLAVGADVARTDHTTREILVIDRRTGHLLEHLTLTVGPAGDESPNAKVTYVASAEVDRAGCRIPA